MRLKTKVEYPFKLRVFEDGKIKSRGFDGIVSKSEYARNVNLLKSCLDCKTPLIEYEPYHYRCPNCGETFGWGFSTLYRGKEFYEKNPQYAEKS